MITRPIFINDDHFVDAIIGYRAWLPVALNGEVRLRSLTGATWQPREDLRADCAWRKFHKHTPPGDFCSCGIWAYEDHDVLMRNVFFRRNELLFGEVGLWGDVARHDTGYRAEFARVMGVFVPHGEGPRQNIARLVADQYGVPLLSDTLQPEGDRI